MYSTGLPMFRRAFAALALIGLAGCATPPALDAGVGARPFVPERFFLGPRLRRASSSTRSMARGAA